MGVESEIANILEILNLPFYMKWDFWIGLCVGLASIYFSVKAYLEAAAAKRAASEAGKTVKIQTITIELSEIAQRLDKLDYHVSYTEARDLLNEISRRIRRLIAPFESGEDLQDVCGRMKQALSDAKNSLDEVRPQTDDDDAIIKSSVYFAVEGHLSSISGLVAEIMGLFEKRTISVE
ncbi:hypothetical protein EQ826_21970 [Ectopseudomonas mendocina]|nr:hypothetical protein [Pseudomonas mendocina]TRO15812.1 hypothetical protein EQ828_20640 [Pseudomonas mendocina]TRO21904.1 hypothetical protein EQ826_21970 [Pseudomonas mendocina]